MGTGSIGRLRVAWQHHIDADTALFERLVVRHREKQRRYHTIDHVDVVVRLVEELAESEAVDDLGSVVAAALYHDAIYEPESTANERASARLARRDLGALRWSTAHVDSVSEMIEGTRDHTSPSSVDAAILFDADLSVLGGTPGDYRAYVEAVRAEYAHVSDDDWVAGRSAVLTSFVDRDAIYATQTGRERWEATARANISAELASLTP